MMPIAADLEPGKLLEVDPQGHRRRRQLHHPHRDAGAGNSAICAFLGVAQRLLLGDGIGVVALGIADADE
jgi:hypothetical protein